MNPNRKAFYPDVVVGYVCLIVAVWFFGYEYGRHVGEKTPRVCATVTGMTPVSSNADSCTYVRDGTVGRAHWRIMAKQEERK